MDRLEHHVVYNGWVDCLSEKIANLIRNYCKLKLISLSDNFLSGMVLVEWGELHLLERLGLYGNLFGDNN